jgi:hypothetical protein
VIYRTSVNGSDFGYRVLHVLSDNTTSTFTDREPDTLANFPESSGRFNVDAPSFDVSLRAARTLGDVQGFIEMQSRPRDPGGELKATAAKRVTVSLDEANKRLVLTDATAGAGSFTVTALDDSAAAEQLGLTVPAVGGTITGNVLGQAKPATRLDAVANALGGAGVRRGSAARPPVDVLLVGGQAGIYRAFNPVGDPAHLGAYTVLQPALEVRVRFPSKDNDLEFSARVPGLDLSRLQVKVTTRTASTDSVTYDPVANRLELFIPSTGRSANAIVTLMESTPAVNDLIEAIAVEGTGDGKIRPKAAPFTGQRFSGGQVADVHVGVVGSDNDLTLEVNQPGVDVEGINVQFIDRGGVGSDRVVWNPFTKILQFHVTAGTTAEQIVELLNERAGVDDATLAARQVFSARLTNRDLAGAAGTGAVLGVAVTVRTSAEVLRWTEFGANLPGGVITDLEYVPLLRDGSGAPRQGTDILVVGMRGRGVWELDDAANELSTRSVLEVTGDASANTFILRLAPGIPEEVSTLGSTERKLTQYLEVLRGSVPLGEPIPLTAIDRIEVSGLGGNDVFEIDSRIRVPSGIFVDGGGGNDGLVLLGQPGDALIDLTPGLSGSAVIGGALGGTEGFVRVSFEGMEVVNANPPADALRTARSGLDLVSRLFGVTNALASQLESLPAVGGGLTQVLQGAAFTPATPIADRGGLLVGAPAQRGSDLQRPVLARLMFEGTGLDLNDIGGRIADFDDLRRALDRADEIPGNVTLTEAGGVSTLDVQITRALSGRADVGVDVLGGALDVSGRVLMSADVDLHLVFGIDEHGFFIDAEAAGEPELTVRNLRVTGEAEIGGTLGFISVRLDDVVLSTSAGTAITLDVLDRGRDPFTGADDNRLRPYEMEDVAAIFDAQAIGDPAGDDVTFAATFNASASLFDLGLGVATADVTVAWADVTDPFSVSINGLGVLEALNDQIVALLRLGLVQLDNLGSALDDVALLNQGIPVLGASINELFGIPAAIEIGEAVADYLDDPDPFSDGLELPSLRGLSAAVQDAFEANLTEVGGNATRLTSVGVGYEASTNVLGIDLSLEVASELSRPLSVGSELAAGLADFELSAVADVESSLFMNVGFGVDVGALIEGASFDDAFFISGASANGSVTATVDDITATARFGFLGVAVADGSASMAVSVAVGLNDPGAAPDGRITLGELIDGLTDPASLVAVDLDGSLVLSLPISAPVLGIVSSPDTTLAVSIADITDPTSVQLTLPAGLAEAFNSDNLVDAFLSALDEGFQATFTPALAAFLNQLPLPLAGPGGPLPAVGGDEDIADGVEESLARWFAPLVAVLQFRFSDLSYEGQGVAYTEGDVKLNADALRLLTGARGEGIRIGVISDGVNDLAEKERTGDLPDRQRDPDGPPNVEVNAALGRTKGAGPPGCPGHQRGRHLERRRTGGPPLRRAAVTRYRHRPPEPGH